MKAFLVYKAAVPYLCVPALIGTAAVTHQVDRHVARQERHVQAKRQPAKAKPARPAFRAERTGIAATDIKALPVVVEAAAICPPSGLSGGGGTGGFTGIGIGGGNIGAGFPPVTSGPVTQAPAVPEPSTWAMMSGGMFGIGGVIRRSRKKTADQSP